MTKLLTLTFVLLITLDFITGISQAVVNKELSSRSARDGLIRSANEIIVLGAIYIGTIVFPEIVAIYITFITTFIFKELISILENLAKLNVKGLDKLLEFLRSKEDE